MQIKDILLSAVAIVGSAISSLFGGWSAGLTTLIICMAIDYATGLVVAGVFKRSNKTENGGLESRAGWKGLCRKVLVLLLVLIGSRIDLAFGISYVRDAICLGFTANEVLSIVENGGLMGIRYPKAVTNALALLRKEAGEDDIIEENKEDDENEEV